MKDRGEVRRSELEIGAHEGAHLGVAVLLDDEHLIMVADELGDFGRERKGPDAQGVDMKAVARQQGLGLVHRRRGRSVVNDADASRLRRGLLHRTGQEATRGLKLAQQTLHIVDIGARFLGVAGEPSADLRVTIVLKTPRFFMMYKSAPGIC